MSATWDAIVIGAGPAGMSAASRLAEGGAQVLLVDEQAEPGGQIYRAVERNRSETTLTRALGAEYLRGETLVTRLRASGAVLMLATGVWRVDASAAIAAVWTRRDGVLARHEARHIVVATGAIERPVPVEGWTLPGVMSVGGLQILLKSSGLVPEGRVVLAGTGPLFYLYARQCLDVGVTGLVLLDTAPAENRWPSLRSLPGAFRGEGWRYLAKGAGLMTAVRRGAKLHSGVRELRILGNGRAERVAFHDGRGWHEILCDLVALHEGVISNAQMTRAIGCAHDWDERAASFRPRRDEAGETSVPAVFVAGDAGGIVGARASECEGERVALALLTRLGRLDPAAAVKADAVLVREREAHLAVRPFLDRLYRPRRELPVGETVVCRCEGLTAADIRAAAAQGSLGPDQLKAYSRAGMGPCKGQMCGVTVAGLLADAQGLTSADIGLYHARPPLRPVRIGELAALADIEDTA
jgi:NADPH-dependent 2,4-dienoyl-CoA reductase/sulfur reductase-like enzyme